MKKYTQVFTATYDNEINFFFPRYRKYFPFYSNLSYASKTIISRKHGAALLIGHSRIGLHQNEMSIQRVENAIFNGDWSKFPMFLIPSGTHDSVIMSGIFETSGHPFIEVQGTGQITLLNVTVNKILYNYVILKGSNKIAFWTTKVAKKDADLIFKLDLGKALSNSEEIRKRYAEPELTSLLQNIMNKLKDPNIEYDYLEMEEDIKSIEKYAQSKYHIIEPSDFVRSILDFLEKKTMPPQKTIFGVPVKDPSNWIYVTIWCVFPLSTLIIYLVATIIFLKFPIKFVDLKGWGKIIYGLIVSIGVSNLLSNKPYDYEVYSTQTAIIVIVLMVGIILISIIYLRERDSLIN